MAKKSVKRLILGLGSNDRNALAALSKAVTLLHSKFGKPEIQFSNAFENEAVGFETDDLFYNMALSFATDLQPQEILALTESIEIEMGRTQKSTKGYSSRIIDIDILFLGETIYTSEKLIIPHPRLHERDFVLKPLIEIHPYLIDPKSQLSLKQHLISLSSNRILVEKKMFITL